MNPYLLVCMLISVVHLCIGISVFLKAPRDRANQAFYIATVFLALWIILHVAGVGQWQQPTARTIITRFAYSTGMLTTGAVATFCIIFSSKGRLPLKPITSISLICVLFVALALFTTTIHKGYTMGADGVSEFHGPFQLPFYVTEAVLFSYGLWWLWRRYRILSAGEEKFQLQLLGAGIFIPAFMSIGTIVVCSHFAPKTLLLMYIGPISTIGFVLLGGYAIIRHGLFNEVDLALEYVFKSISGGICVTTPDGRIIRHNHALVETLEYGDKFLDQPVGDVARFLESRAEDEAPSLQHWFGTKQPNSIQMVFPGLGGKTLDMIASRLTNEKGDAVGDVFLFHDVTERERLKEEVRGSEEKYRMLVENANDLIYMLDLDGNFTFINKVAEKITGHKAEDWVDKNFRDLLVPGEEEKALQYAREAFKGSPQRYEVKITHRNGKVLTLWNLVEVMSDNGKAGGFFVIARDVTETKELEQQVKESEEKYRTLVEKSENAVYVIQDGRIIFINETGIKLSGYTEDELYDWNFDLFQLIHPDDRSLVAETLAVLSHGQAVTRRVEARLVSKHGIVHDFVVTGTSSSYRGKPAIMGVLVDITEKKRLQEQLIQSEKLASIGELVSGVAHELNNPLTAIMGYSQLLSATNDIAPKHRDAARRISSSSERCKRIIENLLSFARKQDIRRDKVDVEEILDKAIELREYDLKTHNITIRREYRTDSQTTVGDSQQLQGVFMNLINNASDAMYQENKRGILEISTHLEDGEIVIEFEDDGPGILPEFRDKVFNPFFTTKEVGKGTGLGLSISYGIVQEHGGRLLLDKEYRGGGKFVICLPVLSDPCAGKAAADTSSGQVQDAQRTILVVDDERMILDLSVDILTANGYRVDTACSGTEAKEKIISNAYDLIIADIRMPGMLSGMDLYYWARRDESGMENRIVFMTGDSVAEDTRKFLKETKRPCVSKPFEISEYLDVVRNVLANAAKPAPQTLQ